MSEKIGPTGEYPGGTPVRHGDRGGLYVRVRLIDGNFLWEFATRLQWMVCTPEEAFAATRLLRQRLQELNPVADHSAVPFTIKPNIEERLIEIGLPEAVASVTLTPPAMQACLGMLERAASVVYAARPIGRGSDWPIRSHRTAKSDS